MNTKEIIHKTREDYNLIADHFSGTRFDLWEELKPFEDLVKDGQNILDWGCGNGRLLFLFQNKKIKYFGLDQSEKLLKIAKKKWLPEIKSGKAAFFCTALRDKKFRKEFFDLAFLVASFHHLPDAYMRLKLLKKIFEEMKTGGKIIITVWNFESDWAQKKLKQDWEKMNENDFLIPWKDKFGDVMARRYYHHFSKDELNGLMEKAGFKNMKFSYDSNDKSTKNNGRNLVVVAEK